MCVSVSETDDIVDRHMLYGAMFFLFVCFFPIMVLLESIRHWLIVFHKGIEFSEAGRK